MENEKNLNENPAFQELSDESLDTVTGGRERVYYKSFSAVKHSYNLGDRVVAKPRGEEWRTECWIRGQTFEADHNGYYATYTVLYWSRKYRRNFIGKISESDITSSY